MVNQTEQPIENTDTDITEGFAEVNTFEDAPTIPDDTTIEPSAPEGQEAVGESSPETPAAPLAADGSTPAPVPEGGPESLDALSQRLRDTESQMQQYQQMQYQNEIAQRTDQYRQQLEQQGHPPEQAEQMAQGWMAQQNEVVRLQQQQDQQIKFLQGQANAAEHFATKYDLQLSDLTALRKYQDPQGMEDAAKRLKSDRDKDVEIARLRAQLVPSQTFDDSQSTPAASNSEDAWLDRYNQGDRSDQAQSAARRAAGLG